MGFLLKNLNSLPGDVLFQLKEATRDPVRFIVPDDPSGRPLHYFQDHEHSDIFRAFFREQLDLYNRHHMESLITSVHDLSIRMELEIDDILSSFYRDDDFTASQLETWTEDLYVSLYSWSMRSVYSDISPKSKEPFHAFVRHFEEVVEEGSADSYIINPHFWLPSAEVDENGYRKMVFEYIAANPERFVGRLSSDDRVKEAVFRFWKDEDFRILLFDSIRRDNVHLLTDKDFLLKFWAESKHVEGGEEQRFRTFVMSSFGKAYRSSDVGLVMNEDPFLNTVWKAANESVLFAQEIDTIARSIARETDRNLSGRAVPIRWSGGSSGRGRGIRHMEILGERTHGHTVEDYD